MVYCCPNYSISYDEMTNQLVINNANYEEDKRIKGEGTQTLPSDNSLLFLNNRLNSLDDLRSCIANSLQVRQDHLCGCTIQGIVIG
jgi:hypothetical protein